MPDIHCKFCGEPWDHDELHDMPTPKSLAKNGEPLPYDEAKVLFSKLGCGAFQTNLGERENRLFVKPRWSMPICRHGLLHHKLYLTIQMIGYTKHIRDEPGNWLIRDALGID